MINLKDKYGKTYKVTDPDGWTQIDGRPEESFMEITGKRGYIRPWGDEELELYVESVGVSNRIEHTMKQFKLKNRYDDGGAFVFDPKNIAKAVELVQGKMRRVLSPEQREACILRLQKAREDRSQRAKAPQEAVSSPTLSPSTPSVAGSN